MIKNRVCVENKNPGKPDETARPFWQILPFVFFALLLTGCSQNSKETQSREVTSGFPELEENTVINLYDAFGDDREGLEKDFGFVGVSQELAVCLTVRDQLDPFDQVFFGHGVFDAAHFDQESVFSFLDYRDMFFLCGVGGVFVQQLHRLVTAAQCAPAVANAFHHVAAYVTSEHLQFFNHLKIPPIFRVLFIVF